MENSLRNLQLNMDQKTLCEAQQTQLLEVIGKLLDANYAPSKGSILIVREWTDGSFEKVLFGNLENGVAKDCHTQRYEHHEQIAEELVNDLRCNSDVLVGHEVSEALRCEDPESRFFGRIHAGVGIVYASCGHYVLSLPLEDGRIVASFRASYCQRGRVSSAVSEPWQHQLMLIGLADVLQRIMPQDKRIAASFKEIVGRCQRLGLQWYDANSAVIQCCLERRRRSVCFISNSGNSKMPVAQRVACA